MVLSGCASVPMTQEKCVELGGDMTVVHSEAEGTVCCKIVRINGKDMCREVREPREPREPRIREFTDEDYGGC